LYFVAFFIEHKNEINSRFYNDFGLIDRWSGVAGDWGKEK
jgi:hypothetical protein